LLTVALLVSESQQQIVLLGFVEVLTFIKEFKDEKIPDIYIGFNECVLL